MLRGLLLSQSLNLRPNLLLNLILNQLLTVPLNQLLNLPQGRHTSLPLNLPLNQPLNLLKKNLLKKLPKKLLKKKVPQKLPVNQPWRPLTSPRRIDQSSGRQLPQHRRQGDLRSTASAASEMSSSTATSKVREGKGCGSFDGGEGEEINGLGRLVLELRKKGGFLVFCYLPIHVIPRKRGHSFGT